MKGELTHQGIERMTEPGTKAKSVGLSRALISSQWTEEAHTTPLRSFVYSAQVQGSSAMALV